MMKMILVSTAVALVGATAMAQAGTAKPLAEWVTKADNGDYVVDNGNYLLRFAKYHGYAGVELRILSGSGKRLDQFWTADLTFHPMCRFFENIAFTGSDVAEIQGFVTMNNTFVEAKAATVDGRPALQMNGSLQVRTSGEQGQVQFEKTMVFHDNYYDVEILTRAPEGSKYRYADVWFDLNDDWCDRYTNSAGDILRLRPGRSDAAAAVNAFRSIAELNRGYGVWMSLSGVRNEILIALPEPQDLAAMPLAGISFFDGHDEPPYGDEPPNSSHECMAITMIGGQSEPQPFEPNEVSFRYRVFLMSRGSFESLYGGQ